MTTMAPSPLQQLQARTGSAWNKILECRTATRTKQDEIADELKRRRLIPPDTAFVAVGSLARLEWTRDSDLDWMLLVDGQADDAHLTAAQEIRSMLTELGYKRPGITGVFGGPTFSHELIHRIGGDSDSNQNTTRRVLLLLESTSIGDGDPVRTRVISQLLKRYVIDDYGYGGDRAPYVPGFLLNDFVRFWRTMAVDFAAKRREREGQGWALRRLKLRMSRKLIFAAGLGACLTCKLRPSEALGSRFESDEDFCAAMTAFLLDLMSHPPLDLLAKTCIAFDGEAASKNIFTAYDTFLKVLDDPVQRTHLEELKADECKDDRLFLETGDLAKQFQQGLTALFFDTNRALTECAQRFGVF